MDKSLRAHSSAYCAMTRDEIRRKFPNASEAFVLANCTGPNGDGISQPGAQVKMAYNKLLSIRPTTDEEKLNKTERAYLAWLRTMNNQWIGVQCLTLKIGHDTRYCPDFWALDDQGLRAIDTKACWSGKTNPHVEDDAAVKIKVAARLYPWIRFVIAWRIGEVWQHKEINT